MCGLRYGRVLFLDEIGTRTKTIVTLNDISCVRGRFMIMVDSMSDAIVADPKAVIKNLFGMILVKFAEIETSCNGTRPVVTSDFDIPKTFENAFTDQSQLEKVISAKL